MAAAAHARHRESAGSDGECDHSRVYLEAQPVLKIVPGAQDSQGSSVGRLCGPRAQQPGRERGYRRLPRVAVELRPGGSQFLQRQIGIAGRGCPAQPRHRLSGLARGHGDDVTEQVGEGRVGVLVVAGAEGTVDEPPEPARILRVEAHQLLDEAESAAGGLGQPDRGGLSLGAGGGTDIDDEVAVLRVRAGPQGRGEQGRGDRVPVGALRQVGGAGRGVGGPQQAAVPVEAFGDGRLIAQRGQPADQPFRAPPPGAASR